MKNEGTFSFIIPMALLGDDQSYGVRRLLLEKTGLLAIESFPQKDDPDNRVFQEAKLSTSFVTKSKLKSIKFSVRTNSGKLLDRATYPLKISPADILLYDSVNIPILSCNQRDWEIVNRILNLNKIRRMQERVKSFQGEINETNERKRGVITNRPEFPIALRGANICLYAVREPSQGEDIRLNIKKFLAGKEKNSKFFAHENERVGFQRSSPQNNFRRIIAARVQKGSFCLDTISYADEIN